jgi:tetratricopeptide (TPR) repeat protein
VSDRNLQQLGANAVALHQAGRSDEAEALYRQMVAQGAGLGEAARLPMATAHYNLAFLLRARGKLDEAVLHYGRAAALRPDHARIYNNLGATLEALGRLGEAEASYRQALGLQADYANAHYNLGNTLKAQGRLEDAAPHYRRAVALTPDDADAHNNLAIALHELGQRDEAATHYRRALALRPDQPRGHSNFGNLLRDRGEIGQAVAHYRQALALDPAYADAHYNLGFLFNEQGRPDQAVACYLRALECDPGHASARNNLGQIRADQGEWDEALAHFTQATALRPDYADAHWNEALVRLARGEFQTGWEKYEWRRRLDQFPARRFDAPMWTGERLAGQTILLHAEQGFGDTLQFIRYAPLVKALAATVMVECQPELVRLLATAPGMDRLIARGDPLPPFDRHAPLPSLPGLLHPKQGALPLDSPYLRADDGLVEIWRRRITGRPGLKVGLVWRGNPKHSKDKRRSIPARTIAALLATPGVDWFSLQADAIGEEDRATVFASAAMTDCGPLLTDWAETAALVSALDLVVTVDTGVAHLAGALGKPTWILLSSVADWRWLLGRTDSPWYPTARLFRQPAADDWTSVLADVRRELAVLAAADS